MATVLRLVQGATTVDLNDGTNTEIVDYTPSAAALDNDEVSESAVILLKSASVATFLSSRSTIVDMLRRGKDRQQNRSETPVYITFQPDGAASAWRSELLDFKISNEDNVHAVPLKNRKTKLTIGWTRKNFWEANAESAVPLTNGNGTDVTSGLKVYGCNDGAGASPNKRHNYAEIKAADIAGDLPGSTRLEITNLDASRLFSVWIGQNWTDPTNHVEIYEAESATGATPVADATCSGGNRVDCSMVSGAETTLLTWSISDAAMAAAKGQWVHALVRFSQPVWETNTYFRFKLNWNALSFFQSGHVQPSSLRALAIRDLAQFRLPPGMAGLGSLDGMDLVLTGLQSSGSSQTVRIDYLALVPADGWRWLDHNGYGTEQNKRIVDDGIGGYLYSDDGAGANRVAILTGYGEPIKLMPGKLQRLYFFLHSVTANSAPVSMAISLKVYYRPRRLTL